MNPIGRLVQWFNQTSPAVPQQGTIIAAEWNTDTFTFAIEMEGGYIACVRAIDCRFVMTETEHKLAWNDYVTSIVRQRTGMAEMTGTRSGIATQEKRREGME